jgi:signal transduction histidine kinase
MAEVPGPGLPSDLPTPEELQGREVQRILHQLTRLRLALVPISVVFLSLIVLFDPASWKVWLLGGVVLLLALLAISDARRLRRPQKRPLVDPVLAGLLQTGLIWLTGALESPLVVIYVPLTLLTGVALGDSRARYYFLGLVSLLLWAMTLSGLQGWVPRTVPSFLDLGAGFYDRPTYALTKAAVLNVVMVVASYAGAAIHRLIRRMLKSAIEAREQALELVLERNRELHALSAAIAHELKNPLASISGLVQLLGRQREKGAPTPESAEREAARLEVLRAEVARMQHSLDEMLTYSRPLGALSLQEVALPRLIAELSALHEGLAAARELAIEPPSCHAARQAPQARHLLTLDPRAHGAGGWPHRSFPAGSSSRCRPSHPPAAISPAPTTIAPP